MTDRLKSMSLRQFRERAAEVVEPVDVVLRDREGNFRVLGYYTPYVTYDPESKPLEPLPDQPPVPGGTTAVRDGQFVTEPMTPGPPSPRVARPNPRIISTTEEAAAAAPSSVRAFPKSAQTGRKRR